MDGPNNKIISYDPELDIIRIMRNGREYNVQGDVIAELWDYYVQGRPDEYDICESCQNVEQEHGRWETQILDGIMGNRPQVIFCDKCGQITFAKTNYCPNCGARMDEVEE